MFPEWLTYIKNQPKKHGTEKKQETTAAQQQKQKCQTLKKPTILSAEL